MIKSPFRNRLVLARVLGLILCADGLVVLALGRVEMRQAWKDILGPVLLAVVIAPFLYHWIRHEMEGRIEAEENSRFLETLARSILESRNLSTALTFAIEKICKVSGWVYGEAWAPSLDGSVLERRAAWSSRRDIAANFMDVSARMTFARGAGLPGRAWAQCQPVWMSDVSLDPGFLRGPSARLSGLKGGLAIPVQAEGRVVLVLAFFLLADRPDEQMVSLVSAAADQLGELVRRKQAEEDRLRLATIIERMSETIAITDARGVIQYVNGAFSSFTGLSREQAVGASVGSLAKGAGGDFFLQFQGAIESGRAWEGRISSQGRDGVLRVEQTAIDPIGGESGGLSGYVALSRDVTEQVSLENQLRQSQKLEAVGLLAGGVAHDFNNLLTIIMGYNGLIREAVSAESPLRIFSDSVRKATETATAVAGQLMSFSSRQIRVPRLLDLSAVLAETLQLMRRLVRENITVSTRLQAGLWPVQADINQIEQILLNLILNARDAMPEGGNLSLETSNLTLGVGGSGASGTDLKPGDYVLLSVEDTGMGMDERVMSHIFEPFFTTKEPGKGTGLGLATVMGIVKENGWHITVNSQPGHGSVFRVYLPRAEGLVQPSGASGVSRTRGEGETILLVEDNFDLSVLLETSLTDNGYRVLTARSSQEALALAREHASELRLMMTDLMLPGLDGLELAVRVQQIQPSIRLIYMSGYLSFDLRKKRLPSGAAFLRKPFTTEVLLAEVHRTIEASASEPVAASSS